MLWRRYGFPLPWDALFRGPGALHLEIGFGDGRYTVRRAKEEPAGRFVGLELSGASLLRGLRRVEREGLDNVKLCKAKAQFALRHLFAPHSLASITVNFPDPWPKGRHEKHRLLHRPFFELAASRLEPRHAVLLATDHEGYLEAARAEAEASGLYTLRHAEPPAAVLETKYALKWKSQGKPLFYQAFEYTGARTPEFPILKREELMPHALLAGSLPKSVTFSKQVTAYAAGHVILHEAAVSFGAEDAPSGRWLVRATVDEPDLRQQVLVSVHARGPGEVLVRLEPFGDPVVTETVHGAVHAVVEWLASSTSLRVLTRAY